MARIETDFYRANPLRSIAEYSAELDAADLRKQSLQQNALGLQDRQRSLQEQATLRNALSALGPAATDEQRISAARGTGTQLGYTTADTLQKTLLERDKTKADVRGKNATAATSEFELRVKEANKAIADISALSGPEEAAAGIQQKLKEGVIDQQKAQALLQSLPQDPAQFGQWQRKMLMGILDAKDRLTMTAPKIAMQTAGGQVVPVQTNPDAGPIGQMQGVAPIAVTQTPDNAATNARAAADAAASRGVQLQIARMTDERVKSEGALTRAATADKPLNDNQSKALLFGTRAQESAKIIDSIGTGYSPMAINAKNALGKAPLVGGLAEAGANAVLGDSNQKAEQAQRDFVNAILRRESGAVISEQEFENAKRQYFPQPGDGDAVLEQKKGNRDLAIQGLLAEVPEAKRASITPVNSPKPGGLPDMTPPRTPRKPLSAFGS